MNPDALKTVCAEPAKKREVRVPDTSRKKALLRLNKGGGSAYPLLLPDAFGGDFCPGMTMRDRFAMAALQGLLSDPSRSGISEDYARWAFTFADEMLKARKSDES